MNVIGCLGLFFLMFTFFGLRTHGLESQKQNSRRISVAIREFLLKTNSQHVHILFDPNNSKLATDVLKMLVAQPFTAQVYHIANKKQIEQHWEKMKTLISINTAQVVSIVIATTKTAELHLNQINRSEMSLRNFLHVFIWQDWPDNAFKLKTSNEAARIIIYSWYSSTKIFKLFTTHASAKNPTTLYAINSWDENNGFTHYPVLLNLKHVFKNLKGRTLRVPVLHKPPWYFIKKLGNVSVEVIGGRDHQLLKEISSRMNFKFEYLDPTEKTQGIPIGSGRAGKGVLSLLRKRKVDLFLGDAAITYERTQDLDFSFFTMADSVAFITHSPRPLSEAWALVRPFHWQVWLAVWISIALFGPALYIISKTSSLSECLWKTFAILLKQSTRETERSNKIRFMTILLSVTATYVIGDLYCANLTSLLAKPGKERPLKSLSELEKAVREKRYDCFVEERSSGAEFLKNGTREAQRLWFLMLQQNQWVVPSVEKGVALVRAQRGIALIAGRETLNFELQRFGQRNFYLSDPLNTQYSAIALQQGCPYLDNINEVVMWMFEAGILSRMTSLEYARLGNQIGVDKLRGSMEANEQEQSAKPMSTKSLQSAFLVIAIGYTIAGVIFMLENVFSTHLGRFKRPTVEWKKGIDNMCGLMKDLINRIVD